MAERGRETLRHGPMKPVGLTNPRDPDVKAHAIVQLRQDNALGTLYNMVGFQTKLTLWRAGARVAHDSGAGRARSSRGSAACIATPTSIRPCCWTARCASRPCRACASPARSPAARAMSRVPRSGCWPGVSPRPSGCGEAPSLPPADDGASARCSVTSPAGISSTDRRRAASFQPMNVNFGLFPPLESAPKDPTASDCAARKRRSPRSAP